MQQLLEAITGLAIGNAIMVLFGKRGHRFEKWCERTYFGAIGVITGWLVFCDVV